ncbi:MAG TPA: hypothetical protein VEP90_04935, partial [Methylomirabilota bacterium]|nr:hypothetical protein [Methylomirabilota bacterium]
ATHEQYSVHDLLEFVVEADKCGFGATMASNHVSAVQCGIERCGTFCDLDAQSINGSTNWNTCRKK